MTLYYVITSEDYISYHLSYYLSSAAGKKVRRRFQFTGAVILFLLFPKFHPILLVGQALIIALWVMWFPRVFAKILSARLRGMMASGQFSRWIGPYSFTLSEETIWIKSPMATASVDYEKIRSINNDSERIYVETMNNEVYAVPFNAFEDSEQKEEFLRQIREKSNL